MSVNIYLQNLSVARKSLLFCSLPLPTNYDVATTPPPFQSAAFLISASAIQTSTTRDYTIPRQKEANSRPKPTLTMPHLPNEIWLLIASYSEPQDLWLSLRQVNRQLHLCTEQHFKNEILPHSTLSLPIILPTYDIRSPIRGKGVFHPLPAGDLSSMQSSGPLLWQTQNPDRVIYCLGETEPDYYRSHFLTRWESMRKKGKGSLDEGLRWEMSICGRSNRVCLKYPFALTDGCKEDEGRLSLEWMATMTRFFRS